MSGPSLFYLVNSSIPAFGATVVSAYPAGGFVTSFGLDNLPEKLDRSSLPCLIVNPEDDDGGLGFLALMGNSGAYKFKFRHLLLYKETANLKLRDVLPELLQQADNYNAAALAQRFLDTVDTSSGAKAHQVVIHYSAKRSSYSYGDLTCYCIEYTHEYTLYM